jgi:hypothetical protein
MVCLLAVLLSMLSLEVLCMSEGVCVCVGGGGWGEPASALVPTLHVVMTYWVPLVACEPNRVPSSGRGLHLLHAEHYPRVGGQLASHAATHAVWEQGLPELARAAGGGEWVLVRRECARSWRCVRRLHGCVAEGRCVGKKVMCVCGGGGHGGV